MAWLSLIAQWHRLTVPHLDWLCVGIPWHNRTAANAWAIGPFMRVTPVQIPLRGSFSDMTAAIERGVLRGLAYRHYSIANPPQRPVYDCLINLAAEPGPTRFAGIPAHEQICSSGSLYGRLSVQIVDDADATHLTIAHRLDGELPRLDAQLLARTLVALDGGKIP